MHLIRSDFLHPKVRSESTLLLHSVDRVHTVVNFGKDTARSCLFLLHSRTLISGSAPPHPPPAPLSSSPSLLGILSTTFLRNNFFSSLPPSPHTDFFLVFCGCSCSTSMYMLRIDATRQKARKPMREGIGKQRRRKLLSLPLRLCVLAPGRQNLNSKFRFAGIGRTPASPFLLYSLLFVFRKSNLSINQRRIEGPTGDGAREQTRTALNGCWRLPSSSLLSA